MGAPGLADTTTPKHLFCSSVNFLFGIFFSLSSSDLVFHFGRKTGFRSAYLLFLGHWARRLSWKETAEAFRTSRDKVFDAVEHVVMFDLEHRTVGQIDAIVVDEIQYAKAHKYLTLVYQIDPGVIWGFTFLKQHVGDQL
jgi:hypothetical protein